MTDPQDLPALLAEWTRVHEAADAGVWDADAVFAANSVKWQNAVAIAHYHNTYAALLDVVRGLVKLHADMVAWRPGFGFEGATWEIGQMLSRLAAAGGGR